MSTVPYLLKLLLDLSCSRERWELMLLSVDNNRIVPIDNKVSKVLLKL